MKKNSLYLLLLPVAVLLVMLNLSRTQGEYIKGSVASLLTPIWNLIQTSEPPQEVYHPDMLAALEVENNHLRTLINQELQLLDKLPALQSQNSSERHRRNLEHSIQKQFEGLPARVIYRSPAAWNSSLWIDIGEDDNRTLGNACIARNSPVLSNGSVVGIVDYVGRQQSRVRLITDSGLSISVRAARGNIRDRWLVESAQTILRQISGRSELFDNAQEKEELVAGLSHLTKKLQNSDTTLLLAKGEITGSSAPLWRSMGQRLKGIGFNYDFADEDGPARDLRTGVPEGSLMLDNGLSILKVKDLLVTTGFDGVFPAGLPVAEVVHINPLGEGDYYYTLEALPTVGKMDDISHVLVLPPNGYDKNEQPPTVLY